MDLGVLANVFLGFLLAGGRHLFGLEDLSELIDGDRLAGLKGLKGLR